MPQLGAEEYQHLLGEEGDICAPFLQPANKKKGCFLFVCLCFVCIGLIFACFVLFCVLLPFLLVFCLVLIHFVLMKH